MTGHPASYGMPQLKSPRRRPEDDLQRVVWKTLRLVLPAAAVCWSAENNNNGVTVAQARRARGVMPGVPDMAVHWSGRVIYIELKAEKGVLTASQKVMIPRLEQAGIPVGVCRTLDEVLRFLRDQGVPLRCTLP